MSRIGKKPVTIPQNVKVSMSGAVVTVDGPKGKISRDFRPEVKISFSEKERLIRVERNSDEPFARAYHGTSRAHLANMVEGVSSGFERILTIIGVGYNAKIQDRKLVLQIGFSHPVEIQIPPEIQVEIPQPTRIILRGVDKQKVGEIAAQIRKVRPPEPYKGKGIRYENEKVIRKAGKAFGSAQ